VNDWSELLNIFVFFLNEIKDQVDQVIKILRSDNAKEYFLLVLNLHDILHQSTCPHTPQQNGIPKRKNRHLIKIDPTLLFDANEAIHHWGDVFLLPDSFLIESPLL